MFANIGYPPHRQQHQMAHMERPRREGMVLAFWKNLPITDGSGTVYYELRL
jgi:hypothetical protein